jgi:hypothetical protein
MKKYRGWQSSTKWVVGVPIPASTISKAIFAREKALKPLQKYV